MNNEPIPFPDGSAAVEFEPQRLETIQPRPVQTQSSPIPANPMEMLAIVASRGTSPLEEIQKYMDFLDRWDATQARKAYVAAMAAFKSETIHVTKDRDNNQYKSKYTSLGNLVTTVTPFLGKHGLSHDWTIDQSKPNVVRVGCKITHVQGHSETVWFECPPDKSGQKNSIQELKSAITYAKAVTFESACGLASTDANMDDDGNGSTKPDAVAFAVAKIKASSDIAELQRVWDAEMKRPEFNNKKIQDQFIKAKDDRKAELMKAGAK